MRRRIFRRVAAVSAVVAGAAGVTANALLVGYYVLARPWQPGRSGPFEWLGPANDIVGSLSMAALIPVIGSVWRQVPGDRPLAVLSGAAIASSASFAVAGPLLVCGAITLTTQFVVAGLGLPVIFGWLWRAGRTHRPASPLSPRLARFGRIVGVSAVVATGVAVVAAALPAGSVAQFVVLGIAMVPGLPAYLAFPVWLIATGRAWWRDEPSARWADHTRGVGSVGTDRTRE